MDRQFARRPELYARYGATGRNKCVEDVGYHLLYLGEAVAVDSPALFREYIAWVKVLFAGLGIPSDELADNLVLLGDVVAETVGGEAAARTRSCVAAALAVLPAAPDDLPSLIVAEAPHADLAQAFLAALLAGDRRRATALVLDRVDAGLTVRDAYVHVFQPVLREVGRQWQTGRITVAHEHFATAATQATMALLYPRIFASARVGRSMVAACVGGELHEVGIRMIADFFEMEGWDTYYIGANAPPASVVRAVRERKADVLAVSATITGHIGKVTELIRAVRADAGGHRPCVLVGGYPFNIDPDLWRKVGADASAAGAAEAVDAAGRLVASAAAGNGRP